ncbi:MAG: hypothetical protein EZS28_039086, partial [Streblomastix strix]
MVSISKEIKAIYYGLLRFEQVFKKMQDQAVLIRSDNTTAVYDIGKWKAKESLKERIEQERKGRKRVTTRKEDSLIKKVALQNRLRTATQTDQIALQTYGIDVSPQTIRNRLHEFGYGGHLLKKKPMLTMKQIQMRKQFFETYGSWNAMKWGKVLFTDETTIYIVSTDGARYAWMTQEEARKLLIIQPTV